METTLEQSSRKEFEKMQTQDYRDRVWDMKLIKMNIEDVEMKAILEMLPLCPRLISLDLSGTHLSDRTVKVLINILPKCRRLAKLSLYEATISFANLKSLIKVLPKCTVLVEVSAMVKFNPPSKSREYEEKATKLWLNIVQDCYTLVKLSCHRAGGTEEKIASILAEHKFLNDSILVAIAKLLKIDELLSKKASLWARDEKGNTAFHFATTLPVMKYLMSEGLPFDVANFEGQTPLDLAKEKRDESKIIFLSNLESPNDFDEKIKKDPENPKVWIARAEWRKDSNCLLSAIEDFNVAIRLDPNNAFSWRNRGAAKYSLRRYEEAISDLQKAKTLDPDILGTSQLLGGAKHYLGHYQEALKDLQDAMKKEPSDDFVKKTFGEAKKALNELARSHCEKAQYIEAISCYDFLLTLEPTDSSLLQLRKEALKKLARIHFEKAKFVETISCCDSLLRVDPADSSLWQLRGNANVKLNRNEDAIPDFDEAIKFSPKNESAWMARGEAKRALGRYEEAVGDLMEVVRLNPENAYAKECLKEARRKLKDQSQVMPPRLNTQSQDSPVFNHTVMFSMAIPKDQLKFERRLGEGSFGEVHKGTWSPTSLYNVPVAIKQLKNASMSAKVLEDFTREVEIQAKLDSAGVVKLLGITSEQPYCMVMEFMENGSLRDVLDSKKPEELRWDIRIQMAGNMAKGLAYLHGQKPIIIHGDLKSLNILVNNKGEAKLADFGLAALKTETRSKEYVGGEAGKNKGPKGSLLWIAPELFRMNAKRTTETDIFSLAVVFWEMASHLFPYESAAGNEGMIREWVTTGEREAFDERTPNTPKEYSDLTQRCWDSKPQNRLSAQDVVVELEKLYSNTSLAPTLFSSSSKLSPTPPRRQSMNSGGYMANTGSGPVPVKSSSGYLVKSITPPPPLPNATPKLPLKKRAAGSSSLLTKSTDPSQSSPPQVPPKGPYMGNVYK